MIEKKANCSGRSLLALALLTALTGSSAYALAMQGETSPASTAKEHSDHDHHHGDDGHDDEHEHHHGDDGHEDEHEHHHDAEAPAGEDHHHHEE